MKNLYKSLVDYRENLKLFHFTCKKFAEHKASDDILNSFDKLFDDFFEIYMGMNGKININTNINIRNLNKYDIIVKTDNLKNQLSKINIHELQNVIDEFLNLLSKFIYLLSFD